MLVLNFLLRGMEERRHEFVGLEEIGSNSTTCLYLSICNCNPQATTIIINLLKLYNSIKHIHIVSFKPTNHALKPSLRELNFYQEGNYHSFIHN